MPNGGVPRELHSPLIFAAAAANAWMRGMPIPVAALHCRYEPLTALNLIWRFRQTYGAGNVEQFVPANILERAREIYGAPSADRAGRGDADALSKSPAAQGTRATEGALALT